jgi:hypothetical protein
MNTLYINYTKTGNPISDHQVESNILAVASLCINGQDKEYRVSTSNVIDAVRSMKVTGKITCNLIIMFEGVELSMNEYGVIKDWPNGFCDHSEQWIADLFRAQMNKFKENQKLKENGQ